MRPHSPQAVYPKRFVRPILSNSHYKKLSKKQKRHPIGYLLYVGATYFSGPSPAKYRGQKRA